MGGAVVERNALFMSVGLTQCCDLASTLGCTLTQRGHIDVDIEYMHQIVFAAASGDCDK